MVEDERRPMITVSASTVQNGVNLAAWTCAGGGYLSITLGLSSDEARTLARELLAIVDAKHRESTAGESTR